MRILSFLIVAVATFALPSGIVHAADSKARLSTGVDLIMKTIDSVQDVPEMMKEIVVGLRSQLGMCKMNSLAAGESVADCVRGTSENGWNGQIEYYLNAAVMSGKLDKVERAVLTRLFTAITGVSGDAADGVKVATTPLMAAPGGRGAALPSLTAYRQNKTAFAALRKVKKMEEILSPDLVAQMTVTYPRRINGVGIVTTEQFFAAQLDRLQLNELAGLMISATDFMTRPDARVVFYPPSYVSTNHLIQEIQAQEVDLAEQIAASDDEQKRQDLRSQLQRLEAQIAPLEEKDPVDSLRSRREALNLQLKDAITTLAAGEVTDEQRSALGDQLKSVMQSISGIDDQLGKLMRTRDLPPEDVQRFAINALKQDFVALAQESPFNRLNLVIADVLLAAWVSGDLSSDALRALSQLGSFKEVHKSLWKKALEIGWSIGKTSMMAYPTTSYIAIAISVLTQIHDQAVAIKKEASDDTHLIPVQP